MTSDLLKNINFIDILGRGPRRDDVHVLSIDNYLFHDDFKGPLNSKELFSIGVHPWHVKEGTSITQKLKTYAQIDNCIAIGETGLDKLKGPSMKLQEESFIEHIRLSEELGKPLIIHCVKAYSEVMSIHKKMSPKRPWVFHDFNHNIQFIKSLTTKNIYFSLGENFIKRDQSKISKSFREVSPEKVFFETDEMDMKIENLYEIYCDRRGIDLLEFRRTIVSNFREVFDSTDL